MFCSLAHSYQWFLASNFLWSMSGFQSLCLPLTQQLSIIQVMCFVVWRSTNQEIVSQHGHLAGDYKTGYLCWVNLRSWSLVLLQHSSYFCQSVTISTCTQRVTWLLECKTQENIKSCPVSTFFPQGPTQFVPPSLHHFHCNDIKLGVVSFPGPFLYGCPLLFLAPPIQEGCGTKLSGRRGVWGQD